MNNGATPRTALSGPALQANHSRLPPLPDFSDRVLASALLKRAAKRPEQAVIEFAEANTSWTLEQFAHDALTFAGGLSAMGIQKGDRLGIMLPNRPEYVLAWWGALTSGVIDVSINYELKGSLLAHQLRLAAVSAVICEAHMLPMIETILDDVPSLKTAIVIGAVNQKSTPRIHIVSFDSLLKAACAAPDPASPTDIVSIRYTSGTTGPAKAVAMTNSEIVVMASHSAWLTEYETTDRLYTSFPLHHGIASILGVAPTLLFGGCCIIDSRFSASEYWRRICEHEATLAHIINPLIPLLMAQPNTKYDQRHQCRRLWTAYRTPEFEERFSTRTIMIYGSSEGGIMAYTAPGDEERPQSCGKPSPLMEMQIVNEEGYPVPAGEEGELVWRPLAPHLIFAGYFGDADATLSAIRNLWFHPGDRCRIDKDGYLYLVGRMGDQIRRKGVNIPAASIEEVAKKCPGVVDAAAIAVPSELGESDIKVCVICDEHVSVDEFAAFIEDNLPRSMLPRYVEFRSEMPRTDTHKISKRLLREEGDQGITDTTIDIEGARRRERGKRI